MKVSDKGFDLMGVVIFRRGFVLRVDSRSGGVKGYTPRWWVPLLVAVLGWPGPQARPYSFFARP